MPSIFVADWESIRSMESGNEKSYSEERSSSQIYLKKIAITVTGIDNNFIRGQSSTTNSNSKQKLRVIMAQFSHIASII